MSERGIAVIGAGPAGLSAAWRLRSVGRTVTVYEAGGTVGGRLRTEDVGGAAADVAVQLLSDGYVRLLELARELGLEPHLEAVPGRDALWRGGRAHALRYGSVPSMVASGALPMGLKLRLGTRYLPFLERQASVLELNAPTRAAAAGLDAESIASWGRRELGEPFVELMAYPLLAAYYGVTPEETSAAFFHCLARAGMGVSVLGVRGGVRALAEAIAASQRTRGVRILTGREVDAVTASQDGVAVETGGERFSHDAAVLASPAAEAARLVPGIAWLAEVRSRAMATLVLTTRGPTPTGWFGLSIPRTELPGSALAAVCVQEEKGTGLGGSDRGALVLIPTPEEGERWSGLGARDALEAALPWLDRLLPAVRERVLEARLVRLPGGVIPYAGYFEKLNAFDQDVLPPRVALAGDYLVAPTVEGAVRGGLLGAERIIRAGW